MKPVFYRFLLFLFLLQCATYAQTTEQNLAKYRVVTHSASINANKCGHLVVDGSLDTYWEAPSRSRNQSIVIDLGSLCAVNNVVIHWGENHATEYKVKLLPKGQAAGTEVYTTSYGKGGDEVIDCQGLKAQFVRVDVLKVKDSIRGCVINEVEVIGEGPDRFVPSEITQLSADNLSLNGNMWRIQSARFVNDQPRDISTSGYNDTEWIPASVPGTVMGSYYDFGALPDPLYGDNMHQISDKFFSGTDFWYRTEVRFPSELFGKRMFLDFSGINWKAEIYFNGQYLGRIDGAFHRGEFEVTKLASFTEANTVAVLVHHPENWVSSDFKIIQKKLGSRTTNGDMLGFDGPTCVASAGWNWLPIVKGRNIGIWNNVTFRAGGNVSIEDPWVSSILPLPDTTRADLTIRTELKNHSSAEVEGKLVVEFCETSIELLVTLLPNEIKTITLNKSQFSKLSIKNPKLWWPNGYGNQNLTELSLQFIENGNTSDTKSINFGIRQIDYKVVDNVLFLYCNGTRLLLRGGNWGLPEAMMRCDNAGYDLRVKLHKEANFNMIRNWVGMTPHEEFYNACDRYGVLIFDDFWLANPKNGPDPKDFTLFMNNVRDKIKWVRKHPSLALYCGRNEGLPPLEYDMAMKKETELLDGTRHYIPHSSAGTVTGGGPYDVRHPRWYFQNRGDTFHSELGIIAFPEAESMRRMMPAEDLWPISNMWAVHNYQIDRSEIFTETINHRFGKPTSVEDYCRRAQLHNYESAKAMFECLQSNQGSGTLLWMSQSAWPSLICQLYDHYFEYTASYFAAKKAAAPIHVFWDSAKNEVRIANNTRSLLSDATAKASIYDANGMKLWEKSFTTHVDPTTATTCFVLEHESADQVRFLKLVLTVDGKIIDDNFYWLENHAGNCLDLNDLPPTKVALDVDGDRVDGFYSAKIKLRNTSASLSLLNKIKVKDKNSGESILPVFFDDDYVSLLPNEEKTISMRIEEKYLENRTAEIHLEGWNTETIKMDLTMNNRPCPRHGAGEMSSLIPEGSAEKIKISADCCQSKSKQLHDNNR